MNENLSTRKLLANPVVPISIAVVAAAAIALSLALSSGASSDQSGSQPAQTSPPEQVLLSTSERFSTQTLSDWATVADYVVAVTVSGEEEIAETADQGDEPSGGLIHRRVAMDVEDVLWSSATPQKSLPETLTTTEIGWIERDGGGRSEAATRGSARLEVGHRYVVGVTWVPALCDSEDGNRDATWAIVGSGAIVPADGDQIGHGEFEGVDAAAPERVAKALPVAKSFQGKPATSIRTAMASITPDARRELIPSAGSECN